MTSVAPPGANGTMSRTGLDGYACAKARPGTSAKLSSARSRFMDALS